MRARDGGLLEEEEDLQRGSRSRMTDCLSNLLRPSDRVLDRPLDRESGRPGRCTMRRINRQWLWILLLPAAFIGGFVASPHHGAIPAAIGNSQARIQPVEWRQNDGMAPGRALAEDFSSVFESAAERVSPAVLPIYADQVEEGGPLADNPFGGFGGEDFLRRFFGLPGENSQGRVVHALGSGVVVSPDGLILTNNHVVENAQRLTVLMEDNTRLRAQVIGVDPLTDIAVVKVDARNLPTAVLGDSDELRVGQWVIAIGNPFELMHSVTQGIISARGRSNVGLAGYEDFLQTDASINPGNSGGALADLDGRVVGINTAISTTTGASIGLGFAIPINMAREVMNDLIQNGKVTRGYLGIVPQDIDQSLAEAMHLRDTQGALIGDVTAGGPGARAGIERGDIVIEFNGQPVRNSTDLRKMVADAKPDTRAQVVVLRNGRRQTLVATLAERPQPQREESPAVPAQPQSDDLGLAVTPLTPELADRLGYRNQQGVIVARVDPGSLSEHAGLQVGDLIQKVGTVPVADVNAFQHAMTRLPSGYATALLVRRGESTFYAGITVP